MPIRAQRSNKARAIFFIFLLNTIVSNHLFALEKSDETYTDIETIVVTANRQDTPLSKTASNVTVINRADIEASHASSLVDLLSTTPSLNVSQAGGLGGQTSFFIRGTESNHSAILINGQQQKVSLGSVSLQYIDLNQIERIEIIRGPQSSLHGSDAIGGVINIITKQNGKGSSLTLENGSNKLQSVSVSTSGENFNLTLSSKKTEGIDALIDDTQDDDDEFQLESINIAYHFSFNDKFLNSMNISAQRGRVEYDNVRSDYDPTTFLPIVLTSTLPYTEFKTHNISLNNQYKINENWQAQLNLGEARSENREKDLLLASTGQYSIFTHRTTTLKTQGKLNNHFSLNLGVDLAKDTWEQEANFEESLDNNAVFSLLQFEIEKHLVGLAVRQDDNDQYGKHSTYRVSYQLDWQAAFVPFATIGTGFKAPDFDELYSPWYIPNPDLVPETSTNTEVGFRSNSGIGQLQLSIFKNNIDDFIAYEVVDPVLFTGRLANIESVEIEGLEISHHIQFKQLNINTNTTYTKAINTDSNTELLRRPRRLANIQLDYDFGQVGNGKLTAGIGAHGESTRSDIDSVTFGPKTLPGFVLANAKIAYQANELTEILLRANNLFDKEYQVIDGYNTDRANFSLAIKTKF